jgi:hypothetical protein
MNLEKNIGITEAAEMVGRAALTIKHWYKWVEEVGADNVPVPLPAPERRGGHNKRYFSMDDIEMLRRFKDYIALNPGCMREHNWKRYGEKGRIKHEREEVLKLFK